MPQLVRPSRRPAGTRLAACNSQNVPRDELAALGDTLVEGTETFFVNISVFEGAATVADGQGVGTIIDDD